VRHERVETGDDDVEMVTIGTISHDFEGRLRALQRRPGFALLAGGTLALGIGTHAALFSVIDGTLSRPVDLPEPDALVVVRMRVDGERRALTGPDAVDVMDEREDVFASAAAFWERRSPSMPPTAHASRGRRSVRRPESSRRWACRSSSDARGGPKR